MAPSFLCALDRVDDVCRWVAQDAPSSGEAPAALVPRAANNDEVKATLGRSSAKQLLQGGPDGGGR